MAAKCYWCETKTANGSVASPVGTRGEPLGCCITCQVFTCGDHGERDSSKQEYKCWDCLFIKLVSSAVKHTNIRADQVTQLSLWDPMLLGRAKADPTDFYASYDDFKNGNPGFDPWYPLIERITFSEFDRNNPLSGLLRDFSIDARRLLVAGAVIYLKITQDVIMRQNAPILYHINSMLNG